MKKKLFVSLAVAGIYAVMTSVSAQSLTDLLKGTKAGDVVNAVTNVVDAVSNSSKVSLPGTWIYNGPAVAMKSDNVLSNVAGSAVSAGVEWSLLFTYLVGAVFSTAAGYFAILCLRYMLTNGKLKYLAYYTGAVGVVTLVLTFIL